MVYLIVKGLHGGLICDTLTRSNGYKLYKQFSHLNIRKYIRGGSRGIPLRGQTLILVTIYTVKVNNP